MSRTHAIKFAGVTLVPDLSGALFAPDYRSLLVADLHLEHGASLARRGVHVPPYDTGITLANLERVIAATNPWRLILLGDSFHNAVAHKELDAAIAERICGITSAIETIWISGNHDPQPPLGLGGLYATSLSLGPITLRHEPTLSAEDGCEIAGHLHPGASVVQRGHRLRAKCFIADQKRMIMPAFGSYTGGLNVHAPAFRGLFDANAHVWIIGRTKLHRFPLSRVE